MSHIYRIENQHFSKEVTKSLWFHYKKAFNGIVTLTTDVFTGNIIHLFNYKT